MKIVIVYRRTKYYIYTGCCNKYCRDKYVYGCILFFFGFIYDYYYYLDKTNGLLCEEGYSESSNCTKCALDYEIKDGKCSKIKSESNSSISRGRRIFFIFVASVLTVILIVSMFAVYRHLNQQNRRRSLSNPRNVSSSTNTNTNTNNRLQIFYEESVWINVDHLICFQFQITTIIHPDNVNRWIHRVLL